MAVDGGGFFSFSSFIFFMLLLEPLIVDNPVELVLPSFLIFPI
jgi:hypothetical protein